MECRVERIRCPTLVASAESDAIGATAAKLYDLLSCPKPFQRNQGAEGEGERALSASAHSTPARGQFDRVVRADELHFADGVARELAQAGMVGAPRRAIDGHKRPDHAQAGRRLAAE